MDESLGRPVRIHQVHEVVGAWTAVLVVAVAVAGCGSARTVTATVTSTRTVSSTAAIRLPVMLLDDCAHGSVKPVSVLINCASGQAEVASLTWSNWGASKATATGVGETDSCTPDCATGQFIPWAQHAVQRAVAYDVERCGKADYYTRVTFTGGGRFTMSFPCSMVSVASAATTTSSSASRSTTARSSAPSTAATLGVSQVPVVRCPTSDAISQPTQALPSTMTAQASSTAARGLAVGNRRHSACRLTGCRRRRLAVIDPLGGVHS